MHSNNCYVQEEFQAIESRNGWQLTFVEIRENSPNFSISESKKISNRDLNRYRDVNPFDHSRITLKRGKCDYINASLVKVKSVEREYILTQGPLSSTVSHFWLMVWEQNSKAIIMLNNTIEKNQVKCYTYWPLGMNHCNILTFDDVQLSVELVSEEQKSNCILRTLMITDLESNESRSVTQYHYTTWPDFGVPATPSDFLQFLKDIRQTGVLGPGTPNEPVGPAIIHCSAGIGRSGTFCVVDTALLLIERGENVNVKDLVLEMRSYRMGLIQTPEQLRFSYLAIMEGAEQLLKVGTEQSKDIMKTNIMNEKEKNGPDNVRMENSSSTEELEESLSADNSEDEFKNGDMYPYRVGKDILSDSNTSNIVTEEKDDVPPPIPPRGDSLGVNDYDRPLPEIPQRKKRPHNDLESSTASESELQTTEDNSSEEASGSELERKRRKEAVNYIPRVEESDNGSLRLRRKERLEKTQQLIDSIKKKQKEIEQHEHHKERKYYNAKWLGIGIGILFIAAIGFRYF